MLDVAATTPPSTLDRKATVLGQLQRALHDPHVLPVLPGPAARAIALANDENSRLRDIARLVEQDPALASAILKAANSSLFSIGRPISNLHQAVVNLGLRQCQHLMISLGMHGLFRHVPAPARKPCTLLWQHAFLTAILARALNQALAAGFQGEEFSAGLLHDLGRIVMACVLPEGFARADPLDFHEGPDLLRHEQHALGSDHCFIGAWYGAHNRLPHPLVRVIRDHHDPAVRGEHTLLIQLVAAADHLANHLARGEEPAAYDAAANAALTALLAGWSEDRRQPLYEQLPELMSRALAEAEQSRTLL
jgi:HD-like signal output (HDOD) protein